MSNKEDRFYCSKCLGCSNWGKPIKESLPQVSSTTKVPLLIIQDFQQNDILHTPLICGDVASLHFYHLVRETYGGHFEPPRQRKGRLSHWSLNKDYQKGIYNYYISDRSGQRIYIKDVAWEISAKFVILDGVDLKEEIERIRQIAYNDRRKARKLKVSPVEVARERFAQLELELDDN